MSNIEPDIVAMLAKWYIFPQNESKVSQYVDQRSPAEKFIDIIGIINNKLEPDLANVWSDVCKRDVTNACFYKSGISYLEKDMKRVQKEFKYNKIWI